MANIFHVLKIIIGLICVEGQIQNFQIMVQDGLAVLKK